MAWDSTQTASMISGYQGMYSQQMGYAQQLSGFGYNPYAGNTGVTANNMMLGGMRGFGHAANIGMTGLGIAAGMGVMGAGGGMLAATGVGLPIAAAGAAMSYAGHHMYEGASQQAALNQTLRGSFGFRNAQGGHGFSSSDMTGIGNVLRDMSHQIGAGGEMTSFRELSQLAGKMGQMNMGQGIRDVQTFTKKFKEMTDALKTMAKDLGTSLEGAMEFAQQAKSGGVFGMGKIASVTSLARQTAVSGGLAMSEVTAMGSIGSQISRSIGGLGSQGYIGGMKTIGQIGTAQQMGLLSEEDIYNATGLGGAEGRQAFAAGNMSRTANFLKSGRGRRMLSSMADKDGNLDMSALDQFMSGGMGVGETMGNWADRKDKIGRANFIRNEGRLRGQVLEKIGGFGDAMQMMQWARSKGVDINNMDDRSMLFAQRQLGMGRDEADAAIKMAQNMPAIIAQQNADASSDKYFQKIAQQRKTQGIEGIKNRFAQAQEQINGTLEKVGQDIFNHGSEQIERFLNKLAGVYVSSTTKDIEGITRDIRGGGAAGAEAARRYMGMGKGAMDLRGVKGINMPSQGGSLYDSLSRGSQGDFMSSLKSDAATGVGIWGGETAKFLLQGQSGMSRMKAAGYDMSDVTSLKGAARDKEIQRRLDLIGAQKEAASRFNSEFADMGKANKDALLSAYGMGALDGTNGDVRMKAFEGKVLPGLSKDVQERYKKADAVTKAQIIGNMEAAAGISGPNAIGSKLGVEDAVAAKLGKGFSTVGEEEEYLGSLVRGNKGQVSTGSKVKSGLVKGLLGPLGGALLGGKVDNYFSGGTQESNAAAGRVLKSKEYMAATADLFGLKGEERAGKLRELNARLAPMDAGVEKSMYQDLISLSEYEQTGNKDILKRMGISEEEAKSRTANIKSVYAHQATENSKAIIAQEKQRHADVYKGFKDKGLIDSNGNIRKLTGKEAAALGAGGQAFLKDMADYEAMGKDAGYNEDIAKRQGQLHGNLAGMSMAQRRAIAAMAGGTEFGAAAASMNTVESRLRKGGKLGGAGSLAYALGMDARDAKGITSDEQLLGRFGLADNKQAKQLLEDAQHHMKGGDKGLAAGSLADIKKLIDAAKIEEDKKKKQQAAEEDPSYQLMKKVESHLEKMEGHTKNLGNMSNRLDQMVQSEANK